MCVRVRWYSLAWHYVVRIHVYNFNFVKKKKKYNRVRTLRTSRRVQYAIHVPCCITMFVLFQRIVGVRIRLFLIVYNIRRFIHEPLIRNVHQIHKMSSVRWSDHNQCLRMFWMLQSRLKFSNPVSFIIFYMCSHTFFFKTARNDGP
jgi:hypothetical protein